MKAPLAASLIAISCALLSPSCSNSPPGPQGGAKLATRYGVVAAMQDFQRRQVVASFTAYDGDRLELAGCTQEDVAGCRVSACEASFGDGGAESPLNGPRFHAGPITFDFGTSKWVINPKTDGLYESKREDMPLWQTGAAISVAAAGGSVPGFTATVRAPDDVVFTAPVYSSDPRTVSRRADLALAWTGGGVGDVFANVTLQSSTKLVTVSCVFPSSLGAAAIPAAVLAKFPPGEVFLSASPGSTTEVSAGDWNVNLLAGITTHMLFLKLILE